jgi:hypothetical protein
MDNCPHVLAVLAEYGDGYERKYHAAFKLKENYPGDHLSFFSESEASRILSNEDFEDYMSSPYHDSPDDYYEDDE